MAVKNIRANLIKRRGWYHVMISYYDNGKRKQKSIATGLSVKGNKHRAEQRRNELLSEWEQRLALNNSDMLFTDFLMDWLEHHRSRITDASYSEYQKTINRVIVPYFESFENGLTLFDLQPSHIQNFYDYRMREHGTSARTIIKYHANIHRSLDYAVKMGHIATNPADKVELPKATEHRANFYTVDELKTLIEKSHGTVLEPVVRLAAWFGLRRGEIIGMRWSSIDFDKRILRVTGVIRDKGVSSEKIQGMYFSETAKSKSAIRSFHMTDEMVAYFQNLKAQQDERRTLKLYNHTWDDFVCVRDNGDLLTLGYVTMYFPKLCESCGLRKLKLHELRHTNISLLLSQGASMKDCQSWAGHSNFSITANVYGHCMDDSQTKLSESISSLLANC